MTFKRTSIALFGLTSLGCLLAFQNCGNMKAKDNAQDLSSLEGPQSEMTLFGSDGSASDTIVTGKDYKIQIHGALLGGEGRIEGCASSNATCSATTEAPTEMTADSLACFVSCADAGDAKFTLYYRNPEGFSTSSETKSYPVAVNPDLPPPPPEPVLGTVVEFTIPAGTGQGNWNTEATRLELYVGQTLRIKSADTTNHILHTGGRPCPHGPNTTINAAPYDCRIGSAFAPANAGQEVYDHLLGTGSKFYIKALDGRALYATNCASCHGPIATSAKRLKSFNTIKAALAARPEMRTIVLTDSEIKAIAFSLAN